MKLQLLKYIFGVTLGLMFTGCSAQVEDYIRQAKPERLNNPPPDLTEGSPLTLKVSPGKFNGSASDMAVQGTITISNQTFSMGSDLSVSLAISKSRVILQ